MPPVVMQAACAPAAAGGLAGGAGPRAVAGAGAGAFAGGGAAAVAATTAVQAQVPEVCPRGGGGATAASGGPASSAVVQPSVRPGRQFAGQHAQAQVRTQTAAQCLGGGRAHRVCRHAHSVSTVVHAVPRNQNLLPCASRHPRTPALSPISYWQPHVPPPRLLEQVAAAQRDAASANTAAASRSGPWAIVLPICTPAHGHVHVPAEPRPARGSVAATVAVAAAADARWIGRAQVSGGAWAARLQYASTRGRPGTILVDKTEN